MKSPHIQPRWLTLGCIGIGAVNMANAIRSAWQQQWNDCAVAAACAVYMAWLVFRTPRRTE